MSLLSWINSESKHLRSLFENLNVLDEDKATLAKEISISFTKSKKRN
jgi:hypothetical protein